MSTGRIHAIAVTNNTGSVIFERFYEASSEASRAEVRAAFKRSSDFIGKKAEDSKCYVGSYRGATIVFMPLIDVIFYSLGSGDYDELTLAEVLDTIVIALRDVLTKPPTETVLLENYSVLCLTLDEIIVEGVFHNSDKDVIRKATKLKVNFIQTMYGLQDEM